MRLPVLPLIALSATPQISAANWYEEMQIGPAWSHSFSSTSDEKEKVAAVKGVLVDLGSGHRALFDTETLRVVSSYEGGVHWGGTPWTGAHGALVRIANEKNEIFATLPGPGWADDKGSFADTRGTMKVVTYTARREASESEASVGNLSHAAFKGYHRHGSRIIFHYEVLGTRVLESLEATPAGIVRHFQIAPHAQALAFVVADEKADFTAAGATASTASGLHIATGGMGVALENTGGRMIGRIAPSEQTLSFTIAYSRKGTAQPAEPADLAKLLGGGEGIWPGTLTTAGQPAKDTNGPWVSDVVTLPVDNPWKANMRVGAFDFLDNDSAALATWNGDIWVVKGLSGDFSKLEWKRFASGLYEPLGLKVVNGVIHVHARDQICKLHDLNGDGEADHYEALYHGSTVSPNFHEYVFDLQTDREGNFYFGKAAPVRPGGRGFDPILPHHGTVGKLSPDGSKFEIVATGLRAPGGIGIGPNGEITTGENEGSWQARCKINFITRDQAPAFFGTEPSRHELTDAAYTEPLCYLPMEVDNSGGSQVWTPAEGALGLKGGELLHLSYGQSSVYRVLPATASGTLQGGVVKMPIKLASSAMRARFHEDGSLFVCGFRGWQTNAASEAGFQRVRFTGATVTLPEKLEITAEGVRLRFSVPLDGELANDPASYSAQRWNYVLGPQYGSGEFSVDQPDPEAEKLALTKESKGHKKRDDVQVIAAKLEADGKTVSLKLAGHKPSMQLKVTWDLESTEGLPIRSELHATVRQLGD
jgi:hypothetical protein